MAPSTYGRYRVMKKITLVIVQLVDQIWEISVSMVRRWSYALVDGEVRNECVLYREKHTSTDKLPTALTHSAWQ
jgi:hypothetical protein